MSDERYDKLALEIANTFVDAIGHGVDNLLDGLINFLYGNPQISKEIVVARFPHLVDTKSIQEIELVFLVSFNDNDELFSIGNSSYHPDSFNLPKIQTELIMHMPVFAREGVDKDTLLSSLSAVQGELATSLRHELEHAKQHHAAMTRTGGCFIDVHESFMAEYSRFSYEARDLYDSYLKYFVNQQELDAYIAQFHFQHKVIGYELNNIIESFIFERSEQIRIEYDRREYSEEGLKQSILNFANNYLFGTRQKQSKNFKLALREIIHLHYSTRYFDSYNSTDLAKYHDIF